MHFELLSKCPFTVWHTTCCTRCFTCNLHTIVPWALECTCWRLFTVQWEDCKNLKLHLSMPLWLLSLLLLFPFPDITDLGYRKISAIQTMFYLWLAVGSKCICITSLTFEKAAPPHSFPSLAQMNWKDWVFKNQPTNCRAFSLKRR